MTIPDNLQTLIERRDYLAVRITGKRSLGWETTYDEREHKALCWAVEILSKFAPIHSLFIRFQKWRVRQEGVG